ncbi:gamma-glutamylcyclotransferase [Pendulispora brunnea]|uniref:Gamma-glutamylcyclotransferase n=1 Tax=Pendulispora brunnea TaxID=2905690 RepID=A0ABZ2KG26_9BACT
MTTPRVWTFFYGSYINLDVLKDAADLVPQGVERAMLGGFDIRIAPRANLVRSDGHSVYGILATATHAELVRLYKHSEDVLGETYLPEAVLARTSSGDYRPALTYICPEMIPRPAEAAYVNRIVVAARQFQFADEYIARILAFAPK